MNTERPEDLTVEEVYTLYSYPEMIKFIEVLTAKRKLLLESSPHLAQTGDQWQHIKGRLQVMDDIVGYKVYTEMLEAQEQQEAKAFESSIV